MLRLINEPDLGRNLGEAGRRLMLNEFTLDRTLDDLDGFYRKLAQAHGLPVPSRQNASA